MFGMSSWRGHWITDSPPHMSLTRMELHELELDGGHRGYVMKQSDAAPDFRLVRLPTIVSQQLSI